MLEDFGHSICLAAGAIALFSFLSVGAWAASRKAERIATERLALYRKLADSPAESVELVLARLREEDVRQKERDQEKARAARPGAREAGAVLLAAGTGLSVFLNAVAPNEGVWTLGIMVILIGLVFIGFTLFDRPTDPKP